MQQQETREIVYQQMRPSWQGGGVDKEVSFTAHRSRWGWHPVSYEDFQILRELHKRYWQTLRGAYAWQRWARKEPQNRVRRERIFESTGSACHDPARQVGWRLICPWKEPTVDPFFIDTSTPSEFHWHHEKYWWRNRRHHLLFTPKLGPPIVQRGRKDQLPKRRKPCIVEDFNLARMPQEDPEKLVPLDMSFYRAVWDELTAGAV